MTKLQIQIAELLKGYFSYREIARRLGVRLSTVDEVANPKKHLARKLVWRAVAKGTLKKPASCQRCKKPSRVEAHHEDYDKPLDVKWLCAECHTEVHHGPPKAPKVLDLIGRYMSEMGKKGASCGSSADKARAAYARVAKQLKRRAAEAAKSGRSDEAAVLQLRANEYEQRAA